MLFIQFTRATSIRSMACNASICLLLCDAAQAQTQAIAPTPGASAAQRTKPEQRVEQIRIEDTANRIDEVRFGGETRSITVQPKGGMPSYQVAPTTGERRWNVLDF